MKTPISWHFIQFQTTTHKILFSVFKAFFQRNKQGNIFDWGPGALPPEAKGFF